MVTQAAYEPPPLYNTPAATLLTTHSVTSNLHLVDTPFIMIYLDRLMAAAERIINHSFPCSDV